MPDNESYLDRSIRDLHASDQHDHKEILKALTSILESNRLVMEEFRAMTIEFKTQNEEFNKFVDLKPKIEALEKQVHDADIETASWRSRVDVQSKVLWVVGTGVMISLISQLSGKLF